MYKEKNKVRITNVGTKFCRNSQPQVGGYPGAEQDQMDINEEHTAHKMRNSVSSLILPPPAFLVLLAVRE